MTQLTNQCFIVGKGIPNKETPPLGYIARDIITTLNNVSVEVTLISCSNCFYYKNDVFVFS